MVVQGLNVPLRWSGRVYSGVVNSPRSQPRSTFLLFCSGLDISANSVGFIRIMMAVNQDVSRELGRSSEFVLQMFTLVAEVLPNMDIGCNEPPHSGSLPYCKRARLKNQSALSSGAD